MCTICDDRPEFSRSDAIRHERSLKHTSKVDELCEERRKELECQAAVRADIDRQYLDLFGNGSGSGSASVVTGVQSRYEGSSSSHPAPARQDDTRLNWGGDGYVDAPWRSARADNRERFGEMLEEGLNLGQAWGANPEDSQFGGGMGVGGTRGIYEEDEEGIADGMDHSHSPFQHALTIPKPLVNLLGTSRRSRAPRDRPFNPTWFPWSDRVVRRLSISFLSRSKLIIYRNALLT